MRARQGALELFQFVAPGHIRAHDEQHCVDRFTQCHGVSDLEERRYVDEDDVGPGAEPMQELSDGLTPHQLSRIRCRSSGRQNLEPSGVRPVSVL